MMCRKPLIHVFHHRKNSKEKKTEKFVGKNGEKYLHPSHSIFDLMTGN